MFKSVKKQQAFTLLELLVVIAIIGILISMGVASFSNGQKKSRDARRKEDLKAVQNGLEQYYAQNTAYPVGVTMTAVTGATGAGSEYFPAGGPVDPKNTGTSVYTINADVDSYCVCALLESSTTAGNASDASCSYGSGQYYCLGNLQ